MSAFARRRPPGLALLLACFFLAVAALPPAAFAGEATPSTGGTAQAYTLHAPISIGLGDNFAAIAAAEGWPGDGSQANPYVISGYEINSGHWRYGLAIRIAYQSAWVVIRDNYIHDTPGGIRLQYGKMNGVITNNVIERLTGPYADGIATISSYDVTITNNVIRGSTQSGVHVSGDYGPTTVAGNTITGGRFGIIAWSSNQVVTGNSVSGSSVIGIFDYDYGGVSVIADNTVSGSGSSCIASLPPSHHVTILRNALSGCAETGIRMYGGRGPSTLGENVVSSSPIAIRVSGGGSAIVVRGNVARDAGAVGILLDATKPVTVVGNLVENRTTGIQVVGGREHLITGNVVKGGADGLHFQGSIFNTITGNRVTGNERGITLNASEGNLVYDNLFENERNALVVNGFDNEWSIVKTPGTNIVGGPFLGGNFWSDYTGVDADLDGLGEVTYGLLPGGILPGLPPQAPRWLPAPPAPPLPVTPPAAQPPPNLPALPPLPVAAPALPQPEAAYAQFLAYGPYDKHPLMTAPVAVSLPEVTHLVPLS